MTFLFLPFLVAFVVVYDLLYEKRKKIRILFKGLSTAMALSTAIVFGAGAPYAQFIALGLALSLIGDIVIEIREWRPRFFIAGGIFFMLAHLSYLAAFYILVPWEWNQWWVTLIFALIAVSNYFYFKPKDRPNRVFVGVYSFVIAMMVSRAVLAGFLSSTLLPMRLCFCVGALLFLISDMELSYSVFKKEIKHELTVNSFLYFPAQYLLALSATVLLYSAG